ncbi:MAG: serine hydrolase, partial [Flavobacteriaceae bacterium]|nr:serine hydrolase [Flavobacteriaceae bacterium]
MKKILFLFIVVVTFRVNAQVDPFAVKDSVAQNKWVENVMGRLSLDQKIGQLFMVAAYSNKDKKHTDFIENLLTEYHVGNLVFMQGTAQGHAALINRYQDLVKVPLLIAIDGEWGLDMRVKNTVGFPYNMALGAIRDDKLVRDFGQRLGQHLKRLGIHVNFAPVVDINTNPKNPIIGNRSFGEDKFNVTQKSLQFTKGLQSENVMACAKHFPGHGDTAQDSHYTLPTVTFSAERIDSVELYPYYKLFEAGIGSIMSAHLSIPSLERDAKTPASISYNVVTKIAKEKMQFKGLIFTDALNMKGAANFAKPGQIDLQAFMAGNDILLFPEDVPSAINEMKKAIKKNKLSIERLEESVRKILKAKYWAGLHNYQPVELTNLNQDLNTAEDKILNHKLVANSITLVQNKNSILPIKELSKNKIAYVKLGGKNDNTSFVNRLNDYAKVDVITGNNLTEIMQKLKKYNTVIVGFHTSSGAYASYKIPNEELTKLQTIAKDHKVILDVFASPYSLLKIKNFSHIDAVIVSYQNTALAQDISAQMIFGALDVKGKLPVHIDKEFPLGYGLFLANINRLGYSFPEAVDLDSHKLNRIDSIAQVVIDSAMAPGLQVLVARYGKVVYRKNFGYYTYESKKKVTDESIYDLASVTKILGGLPMIMKAEEDGKYTLETTLGEIMPVLKGSNKDTLTIKEVLSHYAKIKPYISYYRTMVEGDDAKPMKAYFRKEKSNKYSIKVAEDLYLRTDYLDTINQLIADAPQRETLQYKYSGLPFYLFKDYLEKEYNNSLDRLDNDYFFEPLGARTLTYKPLDKFPKPIIVPTENDDFFRHQLLQGNVHDEGAAMLGGVSGNAGLFGNSNDVAKMMQMYLQKGYYGGKSYFKPETIDKFNFRYFEDKGVRRGLAFDKPQLDDALATCGCVSFKSFGHSGYTGTYTFVDPETEIVYVFLSNRVYPTRKNNKLGK